MKTSRCIFIILFSIQLGQSQIKIGTNASNIHPHSLLELESNSKGFLLPRMSNSERDEAFQNNTPEGLVIYNTDENSIQYFKSDANTQSLNTGFSNWTSLTGYFNFQTTPSFFPVVGDSFYDLMQHIVYVYDGTEWIAQSSYLPTLVSPNISFFDREELLEIDLTKLIHKVTFENNVLTLENVNGINTVVNLNSFSDNTSNNDDNLSTVQFLSISNNELSISNGNTITLPSATTSTPSLSLVGNVLSISGGNSVSLPTTNQNGIDNSQVLSLAGSVLSISNGNSVTLPASASGGFQTLSISDNTVSISGGNSITLPEAATSTSVFTTENEITSNQTGDIAVDDFVFGSNQLNNQTGSTDNARFMFDKSKGAFRAGSTSNSSWDESNLGEYSIALGYRTEASGDRSIAFGDNTIAESRSETVLGSYNTRAADFNSTANVLTNRLFTIGNGTSASNRSDAMVVLKNGNIGIGTSNPTQFKLEVNGSIGQTNSGALHPDYVFEIFYEGVSQYNANYQWKSLEEIELYIKNNNHLPGLPSRKEIKAKGSWNLSEQVRLNLEKVEELYLFIIQQDKKLKATQNEINEINHRLKVLETKLEQVLKP